MKCNFDEIVYKNAMISRNPIFEVNSRAFQIVCVFHLFCSCALVFSNINTCNFTYLLLSQPSILINSSYNKGYPESERLSFFVSILSGDLLSRNQ